MGSEKRNGVVSVDWFFSRKVRKYFRTEIVIEMLTWKARGDPCYLLNFPLSLLTQCHDVYGAFPLLK